MRDDERAALAALRLDWAPTKEDVWTAPVAHVDGLNVHVADAVLSGFREAAASPGPSPLGIAILGQKGAGKTHMLGRLRQQVQAEGGYFFLVSLVSGRDFWQNIARSLVTGLRRPGAEFDQLTTLVRRLADRCGVGASIRKQVTGEQSLTLPVLDEFVHALRRMDGNLGRECQHAARALVLLAARDFTLQDIGEAYLTSDSEAMLGDRTGWGIHATGKPPQQMVSDISRLLAATGPSLIAIDQVDTLIAQSTRQTDQDSTEADGPRDLLLAQVGDGLMHLREEVQRTQMVLACLPLSWESIKSRAVDSVGDRFRQESRLATLPSADVAQALIEARFRPRYAGIGFVPPYPSWPVLPEAFAEAPHYTPRGLLKRVDLHVRTCLRRGVVTPLTTLADEPEVEPGDVRQVRPLQRERAAALDMRFAVLRSTADLGGALDERLEDAEMPPLLAAALQAWIEEQGGERELYELDPPPGQRPALHARLRRTLDDATEDQMHWAFRAVAGRHHRRVQAEVRRAVTIAGLDPEVAKRKVFLLRRGAWPNGPVTTKLIQDFEQSGGQVLAPEPDDLLTFAALAHLLAEKDPDLGDWLRERQPASRTALLSAVFGPPQNPAGFVHPERPSPGPNPEVPSERPVDAVSAPQSPTRYRGVAQVPAQPSTTPDASGPTIGLGRRTDTGEPVRVPLEALRKHTAVFAGSGSGKTVLIRRLVEECALHGVSAIVLDPNNDLARLGDAWPEPPPTWDAEDARRSAEYLAGTEVLVWTPRREAGRPVTFQPLPDFSAVLDDPDEFGQALDTAVAALAPRARVDGATAKAEQGRAVLREALDHFARHGQGGLGAYLDLLSELPDGITPLAKAQAMAHDMAQTLRAAMINDPLFGGSGIPIDPGVLLTPSAGKKARISVLSFIGLPGNEQRQSFVNQLQMALFAWIKQHPAGDRPLGGLFVMDEAQTLAPSGAMTACTESTLALASQARKYGLGLIFATQAPRGIHNRIVGNAATQFYGFLNSPTQIAAARELAQSKESTVLDISRLTAGQFYAVGEGMAFQKVASPMCLSHHPASALSTEEVLERARKGA